MSGELHQMGVAALAKALAERKVSAVEASQVFLGRMKAHESLGTFLDVNEEVTLAQARAAD
ncbi:MAG: Asp-tRNA(Asn)/Glu-tRNA(Gln) amidotransferase GatCAB subunit A, partial [Variovorax paradoxus]|nr:Asp-tRNA(Asn)/Glu-tRNA(Gln) amidotransferase GatCAB subunit A [Variovorax paradoxus]